MEYLDSEKDKKRNKVIALITTVILHGLLLICFVFMGLTYQVPPPPEYGIEIDMGGGGGGGGNPKNTHRTTTASNPAASEHISTQNTEESVALNTTRKPNIDRTQQQTAPVDNQSKVEEAPTVNQNALFRRNTAQSGEGGSGGGSGGGTGTGYGSGTGSGTGSGSGSGSGGGSGSGMGDGIGDFFLNGRPVVSKAFPKTKNNLEGVVKVDFRADRDGNVIYAKAGGRGTNINDPQIWEECEKAAKLSKFKAKSDAQIEEKGVITYRFVLQ
jgi:hypothetical protein